MKKESLKEKTSEEIRMAVYNSKDVYVMAKFMDKKWIAKEDVLLVVAELLKRRDSFIKNIFEDCNGFNCVKCAFWRCEGCRLKILINKFFDDLLSCEKPMKDKTDVEISRSYVSESVVGSQNLKEQEGRK